MPKSSDFNHFTFAPTNIDIRRSMFDIDHTVKFSGNIGELIPFFHADVLPGDTFKIETTKVIRLQPLVAPIMDEVILDTYYFFIPNRLVWEHWTNLMGENTSSAWTPQITYEVPQLVIPDGGFDVGTIADYLGVPPKQGAGEEISVLPFRAYALVCDQWFRSEALQDPVHVHIDDTKRTGVNSGDQVTDIEKGGKPFIACKFFDTFTSALPEPQFGDPVALNLFSNVGPAPVYTGVSRFIGGDKISDSYNSDGNAPTGLSGVWLSNSMTTNYPHSAVNKDYSMNITYAPITAGKSEQYLHRGGEETAIESPIPDFQFIPNNLYADLPAAFQKAGSSPFTINDLRMAFAMQRYLERQALGGSRYIEVIKSFFGVDSPDARLQRSEYLGGSRLPLNINSIEQTSATVNGQTPQGNPVGLSVTGDENYDFVKSFSEFGQIIGVCVARYHHSYQNGLERKWKRKTAFDFFNPVFSNIGNVGIRNDEVFLDSGENNKNEEIFGYQEAWYDYRYFPNRIAGELRSAATTPLDMWHLADNYNSLPQLGSTWIQEDKTPLDRCLAVTSSVTNQMICDFLIGGTVTRPMPAYSIPGLIDHN